MRRKTALTLSLLLPAAGLAAQTAAPKSVIPAGAFAHLQLRGPAGLKAAFGQTRMGQMLGSAEMATLLAPLRDRYEEMLRSAPADIPFDPKDLEKQILAYRGMASAAVYLDFSKMRQNGDEPGVRGIVALAPDGKTDLEGMCKFVEKEGSRESGEQLEELRIDKRFFLYVRTSSGVQTSLPFMHEGHAVFVVSKDLKETIAWLLDPDTPRLRPGAEPMAADLELGRVFREAFEHIPANTQADAQAKMALQALGFKNLGKLRMVCKADGPFMHTQYELGFDQGKSGLMGSMVDMQAKTPPVYRYLAPNAMLAYGLPTTPKKFQRALLDFAKQVNPMAGEQWASMEEGFREHFGLRLQEDLLAHLGKGMVWNMPKVPELPNLEAPEGDPTAFFDGMMFAFALEDGAAFGKSLERIVRKQGLHAGRKKSDYKGTTIYRLNFMMVFELAYAVRDDALLLALGPAGAASIRAALQQAEDGFGSNLPKPVAEQLARLPKNPSAVGWTTTDMQFLGFADLENELENAPPGMPVQEMRAFIQGLRSLLPLMKQFKLTHQVVVGYAKDGKWIMESRL